MSNRPDDKMGQRQLLARVENPVQTHELWLENRPGDPLMNSGKRFYPFIVCVETGGVYRGERAIDLGTLVHLMLNATQEEIWAIGARQKDWTGQATVGPTGEGCPHGSGSELFCNTCTGVASPPLQAAPACTCSGTAPCSPDCARAIPERRQEAGPEEVTHAVRRHRVLDRLAVCQEAAADSKAVGAFHAGLARTGLSTCGACGAALLGGGLGDDAAVQR